MNVDDINRSIRDAFTDDEIKAMIGWAGMAGVGFVFGSAPDPKDPGVTALAKLQATQE